MDQESTTKISNTPLASGQRQVTSSSKDDTPMRKRVAAMIGAFITGCILLGITLTVMKSPKSMQSKLTGKKSIEKVNAIKVYNQLSEKNVELVYLLFDGSYGRQKVIVATLANTSQMVQPEEGRYYTSQDGKLVAVWDSKGIKLGKSSNITLLKRVNISLQENEWVQSVVWSSKDNYFSYVITKTLDPNFKQQEGAGELPGPYENRIYVVNSNGSGVRLLRTFYPIKEDNNYDNNIELEGINEEKNELYYVSSIGGDEHNAFYSLDFLTGESKGVKPSLILPYSHEVVYDSKLTKAYYVGEGGKITEYDLSDDTKKILFQENNNDEQIVEHFALTPDNLLIFAVSSRSGYQLLTINAKGVVEKLSENQPVLKNLYPVSVSPDGRYLTLYSWFDCGCDTLGYVGPVYIYDFSSKKLNLFYQPPLYDNQTNNLNDDYYNQFIHYSDPIILETWLMK